MVVSELYTIRAISPLGNSSLIMKFINWRMHSNTTHSCDWWGRDEIGKAIHHLVSCFGGFEFLGWRSVTFFDTFDTKA